MDYILAAIIFVLLVERHVSAKDHAQERSMLINIALKAKDYTYVARTESKDGEEGEEEEDPEYTPLEDIVDEKFIEAINA